MTRAESPAALAFAGPIGYEVARFWPCGSPRPACTELGMIDRPSEPSTDKRKARRPANGAKTGNGEAVAPAHGPGSAEPLPGARATHAPGAQASAGPRGTPDPAPDYPVPDLGTFSRNMLEVASQSQRLVSEFLKSKSQQKGAGPIDPLNVGAAFLEFLRQVLSNPTALIEAQGELVKSYLELWQNTAKRLMGYDVDPIIAPAGGDKRFKHADWQQNTIFDFIKQSYLLSANWMQDTVGKVENLDPKTQAKIKFYTKQFADAIAPTNFVLTNPEVLRETFSTNGDNLVRGLKHLLEDLDRGGGQLTIRQTDMEYFQLGKNVATSPGKVVFRNDLMELLQYAPSTREVYRRPLLIFPPWINKFYILDLQPKNSFIKWATDQGYTVFVVSWVNPDKHLAAKTFEDYMHEGIYAALEAVEQATGEREINTIGYCIGGTLLGATLAHLAQANDTRITSATFFAAQVDFTEAGDLQVFIDDEQLKSLEERMTAQGGYLEGRAMATTFNMLRANDLIWSYVVNNYMMGREPIRFDLLYWNADTTRMPARMHLFYLRECYLENKLAKGEMVLGGKKLNLGDVKIPIYLQSSREDHIAPFKSVYKATKLYSGPTRFIVAGSGHIAGVINPPSANKYQYWTNDDVSGGVDDWWGHAAEHPGSWWPDWDRWLARLSGEKIAARVPGTGKLKALEDAPGSYVKIKAMD
jgi:polyhydroxyalkanoate synthase